jgi:hypothetical protein
VEGETAVKDKRKRSTKTLPSAEELASKAALNAKRDALEILVCRACTRKDNDPVFWSVHGSAAGRVVKKWLAAGLSLEEFEADYVKANGRWFKTWMAGDTGKLPTPREIETTIGLLDNSIRPKNGNGKPYASPSTTFAPTPVPADPVDDVRKLTPAEREAMRLKVQTDHRQETRHGSP